MKKRRDEATRKDDFIQLMLDAQREDVSEKGGGEHDSGESLFDIDSKMKLAGSSLQSKTISEVEALAQCFMFLLAGQGTTSSVMSFTLYLLALNPEAQSKLRDEVDECFEKHGEFPSYQVTSKLPYLHGVVSESIRMFPPASRLEREASEDYILGDTGIKVPKGCVVAIPIYAMHHDPENFPDPYSFKPERFIGENLNSVKPYTYLPFGAGPRNCIGMRFGLEALKLCLLHSVRNAIFVRSVKTKIPLELFKGFGVISSSDITVCVKRRSR